MKITMIKKGLKQHELQKKINISKSYMSEIINSRKDPSTYVMMDICNILELCPYELLSLDIKCNKILGEKWKKIIQPHCKVELYYFFVKSFKILLIWLLRVLSSLFANSLIAFKTSTSIVIAIFFFTNYHLESSISWFKYIYKYDKVW